MSSEFKESLPFRFPFSDKVSNRINEVYSGVRTKAKDANRRFLQDAKEGNLSSYYTNLHPVLTGETKIADLTNTERLELVGSFSASFILINHLAGIADIGNAMVKEVGASPIKSELDKLTGVLLIPFLTVEGAVRREAAYLYAYKAIIYDQLTDPKEIIAVIQKGVALANSLYGPEYRALGEGTAKGKVMHQFSQFNVHQWAMFKAQIRQAHELGQLKKIKSGDDLLFNLKSFFATKRTIEFPDGSVKTYHIRDSVDPLLPARMAKFFVQDTIGATIGFIFPGVNIGNPVNKSASFAMAMVLNFILYGETPDDWDISDWLFGILAFNFGLGKTLPLQLLYNLAIGKDTIFTMPKITTATWDFASSFFKDDPETLANSYYKTGNAAKFFLSFDPLPSTRRYRTDEENEYTRKDILSKMVSPFIGETDILGLRIPFPSDNLVPIHNLAKFMRK